MGVLININLAVFPKKAEGVPLFRKRWITFSIVSLISLDSQQCPIGEGLFQCFQQAEGLLEYLPSMWSGNV